MSDTLRADGIKLSLEMTLITIRVLSSGLDPHARFLKLMGENRINLPFLCDAARDTKKSGTYCMLSEDTPRAKRVIAGDETLARILKLDSMTQIQTRLTANLKMEPLSEKEVARFITYRLELAKAPKDLFEPDAVTLVAAQCRGNRRKIMNAGTVLLDEAHYREEKTINSQLMSGCELLD